MMTERCFEHPLLCVWKAFPDPFTVGSRVDLSVIPLGWGLATLLPSLPFKPDLSCDMPLCASPPFWLSVKWQLRSKIKEECWHIHGSSGFLVTVMNGKKLLWFLRNPETSEASWESRQGSFCSSLSYTLCIASYCTPAPFSYPPTKKVKTREVSWVLSLWFPNLTLHQDHPGLLRHRLLGPTQGL